jgi:hypothetical protein
MQTEDVPYHLIQLCGNKIKVEIKLKSNLVYIII